MSDTLDVLTDDEARAALSWGALDSSKDDLLAACVTAASRRLDVCVGPVVRRSVTSETCAPHGSVIELAYGPVTAVSSVTEAGTALAAGDWYAEPYRPNPTLLSGVLVRRSGDFDHPWDCERGTVTVGYLAGRFASTTSVDPVYKQACGLILKNLWRSYEDNVGQVDDFTVPQQGLPGVAVPKVVRDLLPGEWQTTVGFGA
jgi:hypothetical protein